MTDQEGSQKAIDLQNDDNLQAEGLFDIIDVGDDDKQSEKKTKKLKKSKKDKKNKKQKEREKKQKKKRKREQQYDDYDQQDEEEEELNSMFDDEAESDDEENYSQDRSAEIGQEEETRKFNEMMQKPSTRDNYFKKFVGKKDKDINALYSRGANMIRENEAMYPTENDPKIYIVPVKPRHEEQIALRLLNKARHFAAQGKAVLVVTATAMRKKYPGKIFVQAFSEKDVRDALEGFNDVALGRNLVQLDREGYAELFNEKFQTKVQFEPLNFVRINKGLYQGDLAQIIKIKANSVDVTVVPRLNVQQIAMKIREQVSKIPDEIKKKEKMAELLNLFLDHKSNNFKKRPLKQIVTQEELLQQLADNPSLKKIKLSSSPPGLIILNYRFDEISKHQGTYRPVQIMPFTTQGNFIGKMNEQKNNLTIGTNFKKGQWVEIISGAMIGHYGIINQVADNIATIICKNKQLKNVKIEQPVQNVVKKFQKGQRVKVISGGDIGKTGIVLNVEQKTIQIWTDNKNSIRVNKKNLEVNQGQVICEENVHNLKKDDLVKTNKNQIGIVLETTKDNIKILDTNNTIQIIGNMEVDSKLNTRNIVAKNKTGDEISADCAIIIRHGVNEGKKCKVLHVFRQNVFIFNPTFNRTSGISVQNVQNCSLLSRNEPPPQSRSFSIQANSQSNIGTADNSREEITVGKSIILRSGPLKGYQGIVKSINRDKIEVRVVSKACTEWVPRENVTTKQETMQVGKTPNRKGGNTHSYVPSPSRY